MAEIIAFPAPRRASLREDAPATREPAPDAVDALRDALARVAHEQPDALASLLAVAFADATSDLPKEVADRLARESAATLPLLLTRLRAALP